LPAIATFAAPTPAASHFRLPMSFRHADLRLLITAFSLRYYDTMPPRISQLAAELRFSADDYEYYASRGCRHASRFEAVL
jgi:hypothetical protein